MAYRVRVTATQALTRYVESGHAARARRVHSYFVPNRNMHKVRNTPDRAAVFFDVAPKATPRNCDDWKEVEIYELLLQFVAQITARIFVGYPVCRDQAWIETSVKYSEQAITTVMMLRQFPKFMRPFVSVLLPSFWKTRFWIRNAKRLLVPVIHARLRQQRCMSVEDRPMDFLQWMMDGANATDGVPEKLAHRELIMGLGSIHTSTMAATHFLYDLCAHPEYTEPLRQEVMQTLREDGGWGGMTANKLRKMDSFLKESQRLNPASLCDPIPLSDGKVLHPGQHICLASYEISQDPSIIPKPGFDGFRYYELREEPQDDKRLQYAMTDNNHFHFGHGKYACPGRFFASIELKTILGELLLAYEFRYPEGKGRPANVNVDEFLFPDPSVRLLMRKRPAKVES